MYTRIFENKLIRVFDIRFKPGEKAQMHWHPNHLVYAIGDGRLEITPQKGEVMKVAAKAGNAVWMDSGHHEAVNPGKTDFHALVIEFKGNTNKLSK